MPESLFWCFLVNFAKFVRTPFLQNSKGQQRTTATDYSSINIVVKGILANETVNYDTTALRKKCLNSNSSYYGVNLHIQKKHRHFSCSETKAYVLI